MSTLAEALRAIAAVDDDLARTPRELGATVATESESHAGTVHGPRHTLLLDPLLLALPLTRTFVIAAGEAGLVDLVLPAAAADRCRELLVEWSELTRNEVTSTVDLTVDALERHLALHADPHAGLPDGGHALAQLDLAIADAVDDARPGLATAARTTVATFEAITGLPDLVQRLGALGLTETAMLVAAIDA
ncbi:MAG: hypothetical protein PGN13_12710 [Patulibacter minatonensis]